MNVKLCLMSTAALFFLGANVYGQKKSVSDSAKEKETKIEEVVLLGYGKEQIKAKDNTATVTVTAKSIENRPNVSFLSSLSGEAAGLQINSTSGSPGSAKMDVIIRGVGSINSNSDPLFIIDGMVSNATQFRNLNPDDIESVSVLKDAAGTSIYGNRGANGVILINTKQAKFGNKLTVGYNTTYGVSLLPKTHYDLADSKDVLQIQKNYGEGYGSTLTDEQIANYPVNTNWRDVFFRTGTTMSHDISMMFGGQNVSNYTSMGYLEQEGTVPTSDFKRFTLRNNLNGKSSNGRFKYSSNIGLGYSKRHQLDQETNSNISNNSIQNPLFGALMGLPYLKSGQFATGQDLLNAIGSNFSNGESVYVLEDILKGNLPNQRTETSILANMNASYKLTDDITIGNKSGIDYKYTESDFARAPWSYLALIVAKSSGFEYGGFETIGKSTELNFNSVTSLNWHKELGKHTIDLGAYLDYLKVHYSETSQTQNGLNPLNWVFGAGSGYIAFNQSTPDRYKPSVYLGKVTAGTLSYFATLDYDYDSKYGIGGSVRRDASYRFTGDNKWGTFWMVSGRWNIDKEDFMTDSVFDLLKLRASYGTQGNQNVISASAGTNPLLVGTNIVRDTYSIGLGYNNNQGSIYTANVANPLVQWEQISQFDVGVDFSFWNRRISGSLDYYNKETDKLYNDINLSAVTGQFGIKGNNGKLQNRGYEASLRVDAIKNSDFTLSLYGNVSYNKSKILELVSDDTTGNIRYVTNGQLAEWYLIPYVGVNESNGNLLFLDKDGNVTEEPNTVTDARKTGKSYLPKWVGGFGLNTQYKGFYLDAHFSFQADVWRYDNYKAWAYDVTSVTSMNVSADLLNSWTATNTHTNMPSLTASNSSYDGGSNRWLEDASFVKLKNVVLGYSIPREKLEGTFVRGLKVYLQGENLLTFTKWKGYDPEPIFSYSLSVYPNLTTVSLGVNIDL